MPSNSDAKFGPAPSDPPSAACVLAVQFACVLVAASAMPPPFLTSPSTRRASPVLCVSFALLSVACSLALARSFKS